MRNYFPYCESLTLIEMETEMPKAIIVEVTLPTVHPETRKLRFALANDLEATLFETKALNRGWGFDQVSVVSFSNYNDAIEMCEEEIDFCMRVAHAESTKN